MHAIPLVACMPPSVAGAIAAAVWSLLVLVPFALKWIVAFVPGVDRLPKWPALAWSLVEPLLYAGAPWLYVTVGGAIWVEDVGAVLLGGLGLLLAFAASTAVHAMLLRHDSGVPPRRGRLGAGFLYALPLGIPAAVLCAVLWLP